MKIEDFNNNSEDISTNLNSVIIEVITENFMTDVIEQSKETPVIVDFWAPWCEPCKQLTPIIEKIIKEKDGKVILAKMNIDESPEVAQQLKIQSIPAVMAFNDGQPIDGFIGVQSEKSIIEFVNKISSLKNSSTIDENILAGKKYMDENDIEITDSRFIQDIAFLSEAIKATIYRDRGFTHPFQNLIELISNVSYDEETKKTHVGMDMELIRELSEDFTEDDGPEKA